jgi:hypothetical protein
MRTHTLYVYSGNLLACVLNQNADESLNWRSLPEHEQERQWIHEFPMLEHVFQELLQLVEPFIRPSIPRNPNQRTYTAQDRLLVSHARLAHCETLQSLGSKMGLPYASFSVLCIRPGDKALRHLFLVNPQPRTSDGPETRQHRPLWCRDLRINAKCLGAIYGSLIPMKKPSQQQANQDSDSYYGYQGGIASPLLAVCDINMRFTYANAGAPACVGDAGLFSRSRMHNLIQDGLMRTVNVPLYFNEGVREDIWQYLVSWRSCFPTWGAHNEGN